MNDTATAPGDTPWAPHPLLHSPARSAPPGAASHERRCCGRCAGDRWRQRRPVRRPDRWRGGNSAHTRNPRCMHDAPQDVLVDAYPEEEFWQDLLKVTGGLSNEHLSRLVIRASSTCRPWMRRHGVHFQPALAGTLHVARTNAFFMGGGKALVNAYYRSAEQLGVQI